VVALLAVGLFWFPMGESIMDELVVQQSRGAVNYREGITAAAKGYWSGVFDYDQFYENMDIVIRRGIPTAYYEGA